MFNTSEVDAQEVLRSSNSRTNVTTSPLDLSKRSINTISSSSDSEAEPSAFDVAIRSVEKPRRTVVTRRFQGENRYLLLYEVHFQNIIEQFFSKLANKKQPLLSNILADDLALSDPEGLFFFVINC